MPVPVQLPYVRRYHQNSLTVNGPEITAVRRAARDKNVSVVLGFSEKDAGSLYMAQVIIGSDGNIILHRRKLKPTHAERTLFGESDGSGLKVVDTPVGRVGALNCWEHIQPLAKYAMYSQNEQIHVAGWPCLGIMGDHPSLGADPTMAISRTYAIEGACYVITSSMVMSEEGAKLFPQSDGSPCMLWTGGGGYARVLGPDSGVRSEILPPDEEGIAIADIDLDDISLAKNVMDASGNYSRPDVARLLFDDRPRRPVVRPGDLDGAPLFPELTEIDEVPAI